MSSAARRRRVEDAGPRRDLASVIASVVRPHELDDWDAWWLLDGGHPSAAHLLDGGIDANAPALWVQVTGDEEQWWYGAWQPPEDWREFLARFGDQLSAWVSETSFGWGEWRESALPDVVARPPVIEVDPDS